jgi:hypothetical protein
MSDDFLNLLLRGATGGAASSLAGGGKGNSTLSALLNAQDLNTYQEDALNNNFFAQNAPIVRDFKFNKENWSPGQDFGVSLAQSFLGGLMGNYGRSQVSDQVKKVASVLPSLYKNPLGVEAPEGLDSSAWNRLQSTAAVKKAQQEAANENKYQDLMSEIFSKGQTARAEAYGKFTGEREARNSFKANNDTTTAPLSRAAQVYKEAYDDEMNSSGDAATARALAEIASAPYAQEAKDLIASASKQVDVAQKTANLIKGLDQTIEEAGVTGIPIFSPLNRAVSRVVSSLDGENSSTDKAVRARQELDNLEGSVISLFREAGEGTITNEDAQRLVAKIPSKTKTKEENKILSAKLQDTINEGLAFAKAKARAAKGGSIEDVASQVSKIAMPIFEKTLRDGTKVRVREVSPGQYEEVE